MVMKNFLRSIINSDLKLFGVFFLYPAAAALFVQLIFLPLLFPQWNAGEGMLVGGDSFLFHQLAVSLAQAIHAQGWSAWQLRPDGQGPAGVAAIFYVLFFPHPWVMIPIYAGLQATSAFALFKIINRLTGRRLTSFIAGLPFWLYPSAMSWYTQNHKDSFMIAGALLILLAWLRLVDTAIWKRWQDVLISLALLFGGAFLSWIMRPYAVQMMQAVSLAVVVLESCIFVLRFWRRDWRLWQGLVAVVVVWTSVVILTVFTAGGIYADLPPASPTTTNASTSTNTTPTVQAGWITSGFPVTLENKAYALALVRNDFRLRFPNAGSNIDNSVIFHRISDILFYLPRAAEIAFLAPFPPDWFRAGIIPADTVMRRVAGLEMIGVYLTLVLLPYAVWRWRAQPDLWIIFIFCSGMLLIYGLAVANVGTLYRFRYGFLMTIVAVDLAAGISFIQQRKSQKKPV